MKKNIMIALGVLLVLAAVCLGIRFLPFGESTEEGETVSKISVFSAEQDSIVGIDVHMGTDYYELEKKDGTWLFKGEDGVHVIQPKADGIAYDLSNLYAEREIEKNAKGLKMYGLDPAVSTVVVHLSDGGMHTFYVGNRVQNQNQYYFKTDMDNKVYAIGSGKGMVMTYTKNDLISTSMQEIYKGDIDEITLSRSDGYTLKLKQNLDSEAEVWTMLEPYEWATDETKVQSKVLNFVVGLTALQYVTDKTDAEMGLDSPRVTVSILKTDGSTHHFYIGDLEDSGAYVRVDGVKNAAIVDSEINKLVSVGAFDIISKNLQTADYYDLKQLSSQGVLAFDLLYDKDNPRLNNQRMDKQDAIRLYTAFCNLTVDAEAAGTKTGKKVLDATFTYAKAEEYNFKVYVYDNRNYTVTHDGKQFFLIRKDNFEAWMSSVDKYLK